MAGEERSSLPNHREGKTFLHLSRPFPRILSSFPTMNVISAPTLRKFVEDSQVALLARTYLQWVTKTRQLGLPWTGKQENTNVGIAC